MKFGLEVHAAPITVCRQVDGRLPPPRRNTVGTSAWPYIISSGRWGNLGVAPRKWDQKNRRVQRDPRDVRELCERHDRYARGNHPVFPTVRVPTPEQEQRRALTRGSAAPW